MMSECLSMHVIAIGNSLQNLCLPRLENIELPEAIKPLIAASSLPSSSNDDIALH